MGEFRAKSEGCKHIYFLAVMVIKQAASQTLTRLEESIFLQAQAYELFFTLGPMVSRALSSAFSFKSQNRSDRQLRPPSSF